MTDTKKTVYLFFSALISCFCFSEDITGIYTSSTNVNPYHFFEIVKADDQYTLNEILFESKGIESKIIIDSRDIIIKESAYYINSIELRFGNIQINKKKYLTCRYGALKLQRLELQSYEELFSYYKYFGIYRSDSYQLDINETNTKDITTVVKATSKLKLTYNDGFTLISERDNNSPDSIFVDLTSPTCDEFRYSADGPGIGTGEFAVFENDKITHTWMYYRSYDEYDEQGEQVYVFNTTTETVFLKTAEPFEDLFCDYSPKHLTDIEKNTYNVDEDKKIYLLDLFLFNHTLEAYNFFLKAKKDKYRVYYNGKILEVYAEEIFPAEVFEDYQAVLTANRVRIRNGANLNSEILAHANTGDIVKITAKGKFMPIGEMESYWYQIEYAGDKHGWIYGYFLDFR